jgi:hypothetical protein
MPLPEATDPKDSRLYDLFKGQKIEDFSVDNLDKLRDTIFIEPHSEDLMRRIVLLGEVSGQLSLAGPIPRTAQQYSSSVTYSGAATVNQELFKPDAGEVWQYNQASVRMQGGSSGITLFLGTDLVTSTNNVMLGQESSSGTQPFDLVGQQSPIYITSEQFLIAQHYSLASGESSEVRVSVIRVR